VRSDGLLCTLPQEGHLSYPDSVQYLYALGNEIKSGAKLGLERMRDLLAGLDHPERSQRLIHVAGTNGKGSTSAMIAAALRQGGLRTGLYTSPHLIEPTERININGAAVTRESFAEAFSVVHRMAEQMLLEERLDAHPSYFETVTAMALLLFKEQCDIGVIEVGLGGRLDATNVIDPELCVITPVAYDHEAYLGNTLAAIAAEKAGILKPGVPAVMATQDPAAGAVIEERAREMNCPLIRAENHPLSHIDANAQGCRFVLDGESYACPLPGRHQMENARAAILASKALGLSPEQIATGFETVRWPGRLELVSRQPDFILDGAHNPAGAAALAAYIREFYAERPVWLVFGAMRDKAVEEVAEQLFPLADRIIATAPNFTRALRPEAVLDLSTELSGHGEAIIAATIADAIQLARLAPPTAAVFFTGSLFLVGEARALLCSGVS
jgi:dihydrofolate synthase/folylpolyglutamate synthase